MGNHPLAVEPSINYVTQKQIGGSERRITKTVYLPHVLTITGIHCEQWTWTWLG